MRVFVTGATGWVGSAVVDDLLKGGHKVLGMTRSEDGAKALAAKGVEVYHGLLSDFEGLTRKAADVDAVIHTAFNHDFSKFAANSEEDRRAILALGAALEGSDRPLIATSGVALLAPGRVATEADMPPFRSPDYPRKSEASVADLIEKGVRASTVRLAPSVHGHGETHGFVPILVRTAREKGISAYIGDGQNRWPGVHRLDAAKVYRLALEKGATGPFHAIAEEGVTFKAIAEVIGKRLGVPVVSKSKEEAGAHFGWFAGFASMDAPTSSARTRDVLGWTPTGPGLIEDLDDEAYFSN